MKYPNLPKIDAVISWSDDKRHKGTIYKKEQSTNHPTSKFLVRVVGTLMEMVKGRIVETTFHTKILETLKQDFSTNSLIQIYQLSQILRKFWRTWF